MSALLKNSSEKRKSLIGTPHWMAPEVCKGVPYDFKVQEEFFTIPLLLLCFSHFLHITHSVPNRPTSGRLVW